MGNKQSTTINNFMSCVNAISADVLIKNTANSTVVVGANQSLDVYIGSGCKFVNNQVKQLSTLKVQINVDISDENARDLSSKFATELSNKLDLLQDKLVESISTLLNPGGSSTTKANNVVNIANTISANFTKETFIALATTLNANQMMKITCYGTAESNSIIQDLNADLLQAVKNSSTNLQKMITDVENRASNSADLKQNSPLGEALVQGLVGWRAALVGQLGGIAAGLLGVGSNQDSSPPLTGSSPSPPRNNNDNNLPLILSVVSSSCISSCIVAILIFFVMSKKSY